MSVRETDNSSAVFLKLNNESADKGGCTKVAVCLSGVEVSSGGT